MAMDFIGPYQIATLNKDQNVARVVDSATLATSINNGIAAGKAEGISGAKAYADALAASERVRMGAIEAVNAQQDAWASSLDTRLAGVDQGQVVQDGRLSQLESAAGFPGDPLDYSDSVMAGSVADGASSTNVELRKQYAPRGEVTVSVTDFPWRAKGDWVSGTGTGTDNLAAFNAAYAYAASVTNYAVKLYIPAGKYRLSGEWNIYRSSASSNTLTIEGADQLSTFLVSDFFGAGKALVRCVDPAGASRAAITSLRKLQFASVSRSGAVPVFVDIAGWGESRAEELRFGSSNNTVFRASSLQNVRMRDIVSFYGGRHYNYKSTDGMTFSTTTGGILTASASLFTADDVGRVFSVYPSNVDNRVKYTIAAVNSATEAVVTGHTLLAATGAKGFFEAAKGSMTAGSAEFVADAAVFSAADVGRVIYVRGARAGAWGAGNLRGTITAYTNPTTVTLDAAAGVSVTAAPFTTPVMDFYSPPGSGVFSADSNDVKIDLLHIENYAGVGLCTSPSIFFHIDKMKVHGEVDPVDARHSTAHMWLDDYAGTINGELDGMSTGDCRIHLSSMNDTLTFEWLSTRRLRGETIFKAGVMTDPIGFAEVKTFNAYRATTSGDPYDLVVDPNSQPRIVFTGLVNMLGTSTPPRVYLAKDTYVTPQGGIVRGASSTTGFDHVLSGNNGARQLFEDLATKKYSIGNTAGGGTSFTITDETAAAVRLLLGSTGNFTPGTNNTQNWGALATRWANVFSSVFTMGATGVTYSSGTGSPENVVAAPVGSEYTNTSGTAGAIKWLKETGAGDTGWVAKW